MTLKRPKNDLKTFKKRNTKPQNNPQIPTETP